VTAFLLEKERMWENGKKQGKKGGAAEGVRDKKKKKEIALRDEERCSIRWRSRGRRPEEENRDRPHQQKKSDREGGLRNRKKNTEHRSANPVATEG